MKHREVKAPAQAQRWDLNPGRAAPKCCTVSRAPYGAGVRRRVSTVRAVSVRSRQRLPGMLAKEARVAGAEPGGQRRSLRLGGSVEPDPNWDGHLPGCDEPDNLPVPVSPVTVPAS